MTRDGINRSFWQSAESPNLSSDFIDLAFDTIIVGAGITGVTLAKELQDRGIKCLLLDKENPGFGTTGGTTAHINNFYDASYNEIIDNFGETAAQQLLLSTFDTVDYIRNNIIRNRIGCDFSVCDFFLFSAEKEQNEQLDQIYAAHQQIGLKTSRVNSIPFNVPFKKAIRIEGQAQFHPIKYIDGLLSAYINGGGALLTNQIIEDYDNDENKISIKTKDKRIFIAKNLVWATHTPPGKNRFNFLLSPYRSYVLVLKLSEGSSEAGQAADLYDPYHYFRYHHAEDGQYLIVGGFDHKTGDEKDTERHFDDLKQWADEHFDYDELVAQWSSQYYVSADGLPYIGRMPDERNVYIATGYGGNGMTFGSMASLIIPDLIENKETPLSKLLSPARVKPIASAKSVVSEGGNVVKHFIMDKLSTETIKELDDISKDEGKVVRFEDKTLAAYRDREGTLFCLNSVCPHMGCTVAWNPSELTWDCPCHGSRFDVNGNMLNGPATKGLSKIDLDI
ncbi:FAD-dependent oxidoreductase [Sphingobacterium zeae]|uniref:FAD-dependent oxidoreductase n=1 Tax=Sphingobacterium zeae TaxID=1776859 RepID=UPI003606558B